MNSKYFRDMARQNLRGRWGDAAVLMLVYTLLVFVISFASNMIPMIGSIVFLVISPVLAFGFTKEMVLFKNGVKVSCVDFFKLGFKSFTSVWKVYGWLLLKYIVPIILMFVSIFLILFGTASMLMFTAVNTISDYSDYYNEYDYYNDYDYNYNDEGIINIKPDSGALIERTTEDVMGIISWVTIILGIVLMIAAGIIMIPISYKYYFVYNELVYNPNMPAKQIVELSGKKMMGNRVRLFCLLLSFIGWWILAGLCCYIPLFWLSPYITIASIFFYESLSKGQNTMNFVPNNGGNPVNIQQPTNNQYNGYNQQPINDYNNTYNPQSMYDSQNQYQNNIDNTAQDNNMDGNNDNPINFNN